VAEFSQSWKKSRDLTEAQHQKKLPNHKMEGKMGIIPSNDQENLRAAISVVLASDVRTSHLVLKIVVSLIQLLQH